MLWAILRLAAKKFWHIDGVQWAAAFAFHAFFSLLPLMILLVTIASFFVDRDTAGKEVIAYMESYVPISGEVQHNVFETIAGVIKGRRHASAIAFPILIWGALKCFTTLIRATNRAWDTTARDWWRTPLKGLALLGITAGAVLLSMTAPMLVKMAENWLFPVVDVRSWVSSLGSFVTPLLVAFICLGLFYKLAPRRPTRFAEVWVAALFAALLLQAADSLFVIYLKNFATLNVVYGAFGGIMAFLLWIYLSGSIFIFGSCLCAVQAEGRLVSPEILMAR